jgi:acetoin:2,6-dichlorophenolindophenol oxidoreductase subunit beta
VTPATPADTAGLLVQAIRCDDPVLFFDPKDLFWVNGEIAEPIEPIPFGVARRVAEGDAATVVTWSAAVPVATKAAELLAAEGIKVDLLDLRTIWPWDEAAVVTSVKRTGRLLVVHEAVGVAGFGAEVVARVVERLGPAAIKAAKRLAAPRIPVPFAPPLEAEVRLTPEKVVGAVRSLMAKRSAAPVGGTVGAPPNL